ncbi:non-canonical purine NTP pyrophosphatase [Desulfallas thermosapovorans]|uniref:XTP/dITP diphosphohydrolase n=1 Tax=Desulfallas thermosapovorans DSM 6562 TaxID=1121431 RepID=A0A5S4ZQ60_9FIRM|nr:non-canonical purine NTP pyrophosphatase [Desulfallas thermosapovorans]TYO94824.1 XTP/dITP diphosphohydrolase [Desulfallas thermosapovorans DSM 6562]
MSKPMRFVTGNRQKIIEYEKLLDPFQFIPVRLNVREPQGDDQRQVVRGKVLLAFGEKRARLFVDHTGLSIESWNDLPGGMTREMWEQLGMSGFLRLMQCETSRRATVRTIIGYCDSRRIHIFAAEITGNIATEPDGPRDTWECLFIPDGCDSSLAALPLEEKLQISARGRAARQFKDFLSRQAVRKW